MPHLRVQSNSDMPYSLERRCVEAAGTVETAKDVVRGVATAEEDGVNFKIAIHSDIFASHSKA